MLSQKSDGTKEGAVQNLVHNSPAEAHDEQTFDSSAVWQEQTHVLNCFHPAGVPVISPSPAAPSFNRVGSIQPGPNCTQSVRSSGPASGHFVDESIFQPS
jgi:hypothetical protein